MSNRIFDLGECVKKMHGLTHYDFTFCGKMVAVEKFSPRYITLEVYDNPRQEKRHYDRNSPMINQHTMWSEIVIKGYVYTRGTKKAFENLKFLKHTIEQDGDQFTLTINDPNYLILMMPACYANSCEIQVYKKGDLKSGSWKTPW